MGGERLKKIENLYYAALEIQSARRDEFLARECGADADLQREVESLLFFEDAPSGFLGRQPATLVGEMVAEENEQDEFKRKEIGHYKVVKLLGKGGMGAVYLAEDSKLDRKVALKILPPEFAGDPDRMRRFVREAKSASALNHPNIITIYEIGESEGTHFIATEFIDGRTLNNYAEAKPLDHQSALEIAAQIVSALGEAHQAGIIHRDIKPDNVMIRASGLVKILDFRIAKLSDKPKATGEDATTAFQSQTQAGMIIGTPQYMSPEQARGQKVDHQTDIFSFGVVFYQMLSGDKPFKGDTASDVIAAVLMKEPPRLINIPPDIEQILRKTLEKDKQKRYQTAKDLLADLTDAKDNLAAQSYSSRTSSPNLEAEQTQILKAQTTSETTAGNSIAVLPFMNMSADNENEYFCDGLAEELLNAPSKIEDLKVAARTSAFSFKGKNVNISGIGEVLQVKNILEGSVRKSGNRLRISVQLINAADGFQLWSENMKKQLNGSKKHSMKGTARWFFSKEKLKEQPTATNCTASPMIRK